jgi:hypothetical protein
MTSVVNIHKDKNYDIYIGRLGKGRYNKYGNPYPIDYSIGETRDIVIAKHKVHLWNQIKSGEKLGCFCNWPDQNCHGNNFIAAINWAKQQKGKNNGYTC